MDVLFRGREHGDGMYRRVFIDCVGQRARRLASLAPARGRRRGTRICRGKLASDRIAPGVDFGRGGQTVAAGVFALTFNLAMTVMLPRTAVNSLFAPLVSTLSARRVTAMRVLLVGRIVASGHKCSG